METIDHPILGMLVTPPAPGYFKIAYSPNIVNKAVVNRLEKIINGRRQDVTYVDGFRQEWVDYAQLAEIVTGHGWAISRPFDGQKRDETINMISYVGLDFDEVPEEKFHEIRNHPFVRDRGFFHYSASHGHKPGICGHWICPLEQGAEITTDEQRTAWRWILTEIVEAIALGDRKVKDLQRLFYGAQGQSYELWGQGTIGVAELEAIYEKARVKHEARLARIAAAESNSTKRRRRKGDYDYKLAEELTAKYIVPNMVQGRGALVFPNIELNPGDIIESYQAWLNYFLGWKQEIGIENAAKLMHKFAPAGPDPQESYDKLASFNDAGGRKEDEKVTFGTTMKMLRHFGYGMTEVFGQVPIEADRRLDKRFLDFEDIMTDRKCTLVKSAKGTGKTELIKQLAASGLRVLIIGHRRALLRNTTGRTGIPNYQDVVPAESSSLCITVDSLHKLDLKRQEFEIVIIDEVEQVLQHCIGETLKEGRAAALSLFRILLKDADKVYCFDADLSDVSINFFRKQFGSRHVTVVENTYRMSNRTIEMYPSKYDVIHKTEEAVKNGFKVAVATNSKKDADKIEEQLRKQFPETRIRSITQENSDDPEIQAFIQDIDNRISEVDVLIYSPSLGTGVSIDAEWFDFVHLIGVKDVTTHFDLDQQANRVRHIKTSIVRAYVGQPFPDEEPRETDPARLREICIANAHETGVEVVMTADRTLTGASHDLWYIELWADIMALRNKSMNHLDLCFVKLMEEQGHTVVQAKAGKAERTAAKSRNTEAGVEVDRQRTEAIVDAPDLDPIDYEELTRADYLTYEQKRAVEKYTLHEFYQQDVTPELIEQDNNGNFRETVVLLEMVSGAQDAEHYDTMEASVRSGQYDVESRVMLPHRKFYGPKQRLVNEMLERAGLGRIDEGSLLEFADRRVPYNTALLKERGFVDWLGLEETKDRFERHLGIKIRANYADQAALVVGQVLRKLGFDISEQRGWQKDSPTERAIVRTYTLSPESVLRMHRLLEARKARYHALIEADALTTQMRLRYEEQGQERTIQMTPDQVVSLIRFNE